MLKKTISILIITLLVVVSGTVFAAEKHTTSTTINETTVNWEYELNESDQVESLKCTNPEVLTGNFTIPSTIDGKTVISLGDSAFKSAGITEIAIPSSVKNVGNNAFSNCAKLSKVNLGSIEGIGSSVFKGCTSLTELTIPKTLTSGSTGACLNNPNITKITFEEGLTTIPLYLCKNTGITEITIPNSVKNISDYAFEDCTKLSKVDLGSIEGIGSSVFKGCTSLTELTIPKTLTSGSTGACLNNPNITKITFEEGLTTIPLYLCKNTGITEITIPSYVTDIGYSAFSDCTKLNKITILDNVKRMGWDDTSSADTVFQNHNDDLTIYCYEDSFVANYAKKHNIKYVYLTKPVDDNNNNNNDNNDDNKDDNNNNDNNDDNKDNNNNNSNNNNGNNNNGDKNPTVKDDTVAKKDIPQTGVSMTSALIIAVASIVSIAFAVKFNKFKKCK